MTERKVKYQGLSLPKAFISEIKIHIEKFTKYTSITDFVKQSVRHQMRMDRFDPDGFLDPGEYENPRVRERKRKERDKEILDKLAENQEKIVKLLEKK